MVLRSTHCKCEVQVGCIKSQMWVFIETFCRKVTEEEEMEDEDKKRQRLHLDALVDGGGDDGVLPAHHQGLHVDDPLEVRRQHLHGEEEEDGEEEEEERKTVESTLTS